MTLSDTFHVFLSTATGLTSTKLETKHHVQVKGTQIFNQMKDHGSCQVKNNGNNTSRTNGCISTKPDIKHLE